jgi:hypothetical protein
MFGVRDGVVSSRRSYKVRRNEFGALVHQLIERMLAVCTGCSPNDWLKAWLMTMKGAQKGIIRTPV